MASKIGKLIPKKEITQNIPELIYEARYEKIKHKAAIKLKIKINDLKNPVFFLLYDNFNLFLDSLFIILLY